MDIELIWSLSYEILDMFCPEAWKQSAHSTARGALTGWDPPSALLSPANADAIDFLERVAAELRGDCRQAPGCGRRFQIGEPWWWVHAERRDLPLRRCARRRRWAAIRSRSPTCAASLTRRRRTLLDEAGALLAQSTAAGRGGGQGGGAAMLETLLLVYLPTVLDPAAPELRRANVPLGLGQAGVRCASDRGLRVGDRAVGERCARRAMRRSMRGSAIRASEQHYLSGFVARRRANASNGARSSMRRRRRGRGVAPRSSCGRCRKCCATA